MGDEAIEQAKGDQGEARQRRSMDSAELIGRVYDTLRRIAGQIMLRERPGHTLQPTALVHEAFARLARLDGIAWRDEAHFCAAAAKEMRRVLVDHARRRGSHKRWGQALRISLSEELPSPALAADEILVFHEALDELAERHPRQARVVELKLFGGLRGHEIAGVLSVCRNTVNADWSFASAWLRRRLHTTTGGN